MSKRKTPKQRADEAKLLDAQRRREIAKHACAASGAAHSLARNLDLVSGYTSDPAEALRLLKRAMGLSLLLGDSLREALLVAEVHAEASK